MIKQDLLDYQYSLGYNDGKYEGAKQFADDLKADILERIKVADHFKEIETEVIYRSCLRLIERKMDSFR